MHRDFAPTPVDADALERIIAAAFRAPSAGFTQACELLVLTGNQRDLYFDITSPAKWGFATLVNAGAVIVPLVSSAAYVERYRQHDKVAAGLGEESAWEVPYWWVDCGAAVMAMLLAVTNEGLGALFYGLDGNERAVLDAFGVPDTMRAVGALAVGHPASNAVTGSAASRPRRDPGSVIHRNGW
jgi:nitroreductase